MPSMQHPKIIHSYKITALTKQSEYDTTYSIHTAATLCPTPQTKLRAIECSLSQRATPRYRVGAVEPSKTNTTHTPRTKKRKTFFRDSCPSIFFHWPAGKRGRQPLQPNTQHTYTRRRSTHHSRSNRQDPPPPSIQPSGERRTTVHFGVARRRG